MKFRALVGMCLLTTLVGCNDVGGRHQNPTTDTDGIQPESNSIRSNMHRERGTPVLTYAEEISQTLANQLPDATYRRVPDVTKDDEGTNGSNIITRTSLGRPQTICGAEGVFSGIGARIEDCQSKNGSKATWDGTSFGASGEATWQLVSRFASGKELWMDVRTGMVWSDIIVNGDLAKEFNWCKAAGSDANQTTTFSTDCNELSQGESVCVNLSMDGIGDQIQWRLPTRNDFLQADIDGSRFVLTRESSDGLWTATLKSGVPGRTEAWVYQSQFGTLVTGELSTTRNVRCIGTPRL